MNGEQLLSQNGQATPEAVRIMSFKKMAAD
jgi:hypothetical protein